MCTDISFSANQKYFGRNLDLHLSFNEETIVLPRNFPHIQNEFAIIGIGTVKNGYPLFYDAINEYGLAMAGLNFIGNAHFHEPEKDCLNIPQYALVPFILGRCKSIDDAKKVLSPALALGHELGHVYQSFYETSNFLSRRERIRNDVWNDEEEIHNILTYEYGIANEWNELMRMGHKLTDEEGNKIYNEINTVSSTSVLKNE